MNEENPPAPTLDAPTLPNPTLDAPTLDAQPDAQALPDPKKKPAYKHTRTGKIARLPKTVRDQINQMMLDGVPFAKIIENIGEPGKFLNDDNLTSWKKGGYRDWLLEMWRAEDLGATRDAALSLVEQKAGSTVQEAGRAIASAQLYELLLSFDPRGFVAALTEKPELYLRLIQALSRLSEGEATCARKQSSVAGLSDSQPLETDSEGKPIIPADKLMEIAQMIKLL
jgi:hypothetical protein